MSTTSERIAGRAPRPGVALLTAVAVGIVALWGTSFTVIRTAVLEIPPFALAFLRFALASALLLPAAWPLYRKAPIARGDRWAVFGLGFVGVTIYFAFENTGLKYTTASHGSP